MGISRYVSLLLSVPVLAGCGASLSPGAAPLYHDSMVEYVEVGGLVAASENVRVPLGPGRSYWFNGSDGSRWAADVATVPGNTPIVIIHEGLGIINPEGPTHIVRHVSGPREVKRGWYGRVVDVATGEGGTTLVMTEDGRRFEVSADELSPGTRTPFEVVVSEDATQIFMLDEGDELTVLRRE